MSKKNDKEGCRNKDFSSHSMSHYHKRRYHVYYLTTEYYVQKQIFIEVYVTQRSTKRQIFFFGKRMFSPTLAHMESCRNKVFLSQAMSHCYKLRYRAFRVSFFLRFSLNLIQIFVFIILQYRKGDFITNANNLYKLFLLTCAYHFNVLLTCLYFKRFLFT